MSNSVGESYPHALPELDVTPIPEHRQLASFDNYHLPRKNASFDIIIWHWQRRHRQQVIQELEEELSKHAANRATARWAIKLQAAGRYKRYLLADDQGCLQLNRQAVREAQKSDGKWVLITNDDTISIEDAASGYKGLLVIERCFRTLKSTQIKLEPMHHWLPHRIEAHIKICVFALLLERVAEMTCQKPWSAIKNLLSTLQVSEFQTSNQTFCQRNEIPPELLKILKTLEIPPPKLVLEVSSAPSKP